MTSYEWFVFFLCLFIFVSLVLFLGILIYQIYKLSKRTIEGGLEDEKIIKEKQKEKKKKKSRFLTIIGKAISYFVTFVVGAFFIFSMSVRLMEDMTPNGMSTMQVVVSDSMSYKNEKNTYLEENNLKGIVLAGRPYHVDPEINHGIDTLITSLGLCVLTEDSVSDKTEAKRPIRVVDQWVYHARLYAAADYVGKHDCLELIQLPRYTDFPAFLNW